MTPHRLLAIFGITLTLLITACRPIEIGLEIPAEASAFPTAAPTQTRAPVSPPPTATVEAAPTGAATATAAPGASPAATGAPALAEFTATLAPALTTAAPLPTVTVTEDATRVAAAFTPIAGWYRFVEPRYGLQIQYPGHWQMAPSLAIGFSAADGFLELAATNSQDNVLANACHDMQATGAFGSAPTTEPLLAGGQEACLVLPSLDQDPAERRRSALIARFPRPRETIVPGVAYVFVIVFGDDQHIRTFAATLEFLPAAEPALEWRGRGTWGDDDTTRCKTLRAEANGLLSAGYCDELPVAVVGHQPLAIELAARLAPFVLETAAERLVVNGLGQLAGPAWQRAALNWARWTYAEMASGRACAACRTVLAWNLGETGSGICDHLTVLNFGYAYAETRPCAGGAALSHSEGWLEAAEWERLDNWLVNRAPINDGEDYLAGEGAQVMSAEELAQLLELARSLYIRLATQL
jgi:hypothetical protein